MRGGFVERPSLSALSVRLEVRSLPNSIGPAHNGMVISIAQTRGGIGATSLAPNLATMLSAPASRKDTAPAAKVALVDLDFQNGDVAASVDIKTMALSSSC